LGGSTEGALSDMAFASKTVRMLSDLCRAPA
jgi:hypothetical protein